MSSWLWWGRLAGGCLAGGRVPSSLSHFPSLVSFALHEMHISTQCYVRPSPCSETIGSHSKVQWVLTLLCSLLNRAHLGQVHCIKEVCKHWPSVSNSLFVRSLQVGYDLAEEWALWESVGNSRCIMRRCGDVTTLKYNCCARWNLLHRVITHPTYPCNLCLLLKKGLGFTRSQAGTLQWKCHGVMQGKDNLWALLSYLYWAAWTKLMICLSGLQCYPDICMSSSIPIKPWSISWMVSLRISLSNDAHRVCNMLTKS